MITTPDKRTSYALMAALSLALSACSGSGSSPDNDAAQIEATLVAPIPADPADGSRNASVIKVQSRMTECPNVPEGYAPLQQTTVSFLDDVGNPVQSAAIVTDECGFFSAGVPVGASKISAESPGNKPLVAGIRSIQTGSKVASTIPSTAKYTVGFLSSSDDNSLGFSITDSVSNKAVIGLSTDSFNVLFDGVSVPISSISTGIAADQASIVMVMDASGSMSSNATTDPVTNIDYSRLNLSAQAAHQFLDQKSPVDEIALTIFESDVSFMDKEKVDTLIPLADATGTAVDYPFPASGFTQDASQMRLLVDAYDEDNKLWGDNNKFDRHPDTPQDVVTTGRHPWSGATAFYSATLEASAKLAERNNPRKFIVAMTDGANNRGERNLQTVIDTANLNRTPVYTIGFERGRTDDLTRLATETGATSYTANSVQISDAFNSIQTSILFQYVATVPAQATAPTTIELQLDVDGDGVPEASRRVNNTPTVTGS